MIFVTFPLNIKITFEMIVIKIHLFVQIKRNPRVMTDSVSLYYNMLMPILIHMGDFVYDV
jgi:hypothetical protein